MATDCTCTMSCAVHSDAERIINAMRRPASPVGEPQTLREALEWALLRLAEGGLSEPLSRAEWHVSDEFCSLCAATHDDREADFMNGRLVRRRMEPMPVRPDPRDLGWTYATPAPDPSDPLDTEGLLTGKDGAA